eukprot:2081117-Rhodomonas_salina.1
MVDQLPAQTHGGLRHLSADILPPVSQARSDPENLIKLGVGNAGARTPRRPQSAQVNPSGQQQPPSFRRPLSARMSSKRDVVRHDRGPQHTLQTSGQSSRVPSARSRATPTTMISRPPTQTGGQLRQPVEHEEGFMERRWWKPGAVFSCSPPSRRKVREDIAFVMEGLSRERARQQRQASAEPEVREVVVEDAALDSAKPDLEGEDMRNIQTAIAEEQETGGKNENIKIGAEDGTEEKEEDDDFASSDDGQSTSEWDSFHEQKDGAMKTVRNSQVSVKGTEIDLDTMSDEKVDALAALLKLKTEGGIAFAAACKYTSVKTDKDVLHPSPDRGVSVHGRFLEDGDAAVPEPQPGQNLAATFELTAVNLEAAAAQPAA